MQTETAESETLSVRLRLEWWLTGAAGTAAIVLAGAGRALSLGQQWTVQALAAWLLLWGVSWWRLPLHRPAQATPPYGALGPGNLLSFARALCLAGVTGFLFQARPTGWMAWLPMACYTAADIADYFDGYLARRSRTQSAFGESLDLELDSFGMLVAVSLAIGFGTLPLWFIPLGLARYIFALLIFVRRRLHLPVHPLAPSLARRPVAGLTMGFVSVCLWPIVDQPEATLAGLLFGAAFAASFGRDGLVVSGAIAPESEGYRRWRRRTRQALLNYLPLAIRVLVILYAAIELPRLMAPLSDAGQAAAAAGLGSWVWLTMLALVTAIGTLAIGLGFASRFAAFAMLFAIGLPTALGQLTPIRSLGLVGVIGVLMLGSGTASLWQPSDRLFRRRAGEPMDDQGSHVAG